MKYVVITTVDEEFEKARKPGAKDIRPRKKRGHKWYIGHGSSGPRIFSHHKEPTAESHPKLFGFSGPFADQKAARKYLREES